METSTEIIVWALSFYALVIVVSITELHFRVQKLNDKLDELKELIKTLKENNKYDRNYD